MEPEGLRALRVRRLGLRWAQAQATGWGSSQLSPDVGVTFTAPEPGACSDAGALQALELSPLWTGEPLSRLEMGAQISLLLTLE